MKVKDLFKPVGITQSFNSLSTHLDSNNCQIDGKSKKDDYVLLKLKRTADGEEGHAYLRVQDQFKSLAIALLNWAFASDDIIGLTLNELEGFETNHEVENLQGRLSLK